jgi:hypothetical protein
MVGAIPPLHSPSPQALDGDDKLGDARVQIMSAVHIDRGMTDDMPGKIAADPRHVFKLVTDRMPPRIENQGAVINPQTPNEPHQGSARLRRVDAREHARIGQERVTVSARRQRHAPGPKQITRIS